MPARRTKPSRPLEKEIQRNGIRLLKSLGLPAFRRNTGAMRMTYRGKERLVHFSEKGASDVWFVIPGRHGRLCGRHGEWEAKRPGERPTVDQLRWLFRMNEATGAAFWTDNLPTLERVARHIMAGGRIVYLGANGDYGLA